MNGSVATLQRRSMRALLRARADAPRPLIDALWDDPDALLRAGTTIKAGDRCTIARVEYGGADAVLKRYNLGGPLHTASHWLLRSRARWAWTNGNRLCASGVRTAKPLAMLERRFGPLRWRSFLLLELIQGESLLDWVRARSGDRQKIESAAHRFACVWEKFGRFRLGHGDMKATNFIVDPHGELWAVDLDGMRRHPRGPTLRRARRRDRERFLRNWRDLPEVEAVFRNRLDRRAPPGE